MFRKNQLHQRESSRMKGSSNEAWSSRGELILPEIRSVIGTTSLHHVITIRTMIGTAIPAIVLTTDPQKIQTVAVLVMINVSKTLARTDSLVEEALIKEMMTEAITDDEVLMKMYGVNTTN